jgi:hypothetical protein
MAHYALLNGNTVVQVITGVDKSRKSAQLLDGICFTVWGLTAC